MKRDWPKIALWAGILLFCGACWFVLLSALIQVFKEGVGY